MGDLDLNELLDAVGVSNKKTAERSDAVQNLMAQQAQAGKDQQAAVQAQGDATGIVTKAAGIAQMDAERKTQEAATRLGANPDDSANILGTISDSWKRGALAADQQSNELYDKMNTKFLDHPIDFIVNKITFEDDVKRLELAERMRDTAKTTLTEAQGLTQGAAATHAALKSTVTSATLEAQLKGVQAGVDEKVAQLRTQNAGIQVGDLQVLSTMDATTLNNAVHKFSAQKSAEQLNISKQSLQLQKNADGRAAEMHKAQLEKMKTMLEDDKTERADLENIAATVRTGAGAMGIKDVTAMGTGKILQMLKIKADGFQDYLSAGIKSQSNGTPIVADNPGESARIVTTNGAPMRPEQASVKNLLTQSFANATDPKVAAVSGYNPAKLADVTAAAGRTILTKAAAMADNIDPKDGSNIYAAPPLTSIVELPAVKNSKFFRAVLETHMKAGGLQEFNPQQLTSLTTAAIKAGTISFNEAATGLQAMHSGAVMINNATKNFKGLGLPMQTSFNVTLPNNIGVPQKFNLSNAADINRLLMKSMAPENIATGRAQNPFQFN